MKLIRRRKKIVPVPFDGNFLKKIDHAVPGHFSNRSEFIREACREKLERLTMEEKDLIYEKGYQSIPEKSDLSKISGKLISQTWSDEDWS